MHRDQKIGMALAVLLIGFAGAFCFRHEPIPPAQSLALNNAEELDLRIEHLPIRAYTEREGVRLPGTSPENAPPLEPDGPLSEVLVLPLPIGENDGDIIDLFAGPPEPLRVAAPPPPVIRRRQPDSTSEYFSELAFETEARDVVQPAPETEHSKSDPIAAELSDESGETASDRTTEYVVQPGDTLSGIALHFLGSTTRYTELFEANRDVLANPNSLRAGVVLRIPQR